MRNAIVTIPFIALIFLGASAFHVGEFSGKFSAIGLTSIIVAFNVLFGIRLIRLLKKLNLTETAKEYATSMGINIATAACGAVAWYMGSTGGAYFCWIISSVWFIFDIVDAVSDGFDEFVKNDRNGGENS